ncbi:MAG: hypothetical protein ACJ76K_05625 [Solirubrobacteraceae bacterium]
MALALDAAVGDRPVSDLAGAPPVEPRSDFAGLVDGLSVVGLPARG